MGIKAGKKQLRSGIRRLWAAALSFMVVLLWLQTAGCGGNKKSAGYTLYFMNNGANKLVTMQYQTDTTEIPALMEELLDAMNKRPAKDDMQVIKPEHVQLERVEINAGVAGIYFSKEYNDMDNARELLLRAGIVKTLMQVESVEYVQIYVDGNPAQYADGTPIGILSERDFVDDSNEAVGSVEWKEINVYYANKLGDKLVKKKETIACSKNVSLEKMVVEQLIKGPSDAAMMSALPSDLKLLSISVSEGVCYVNFNAVFLTEMVNVSSELPIYSIANSLCDLNSVDSVRIMINGDSSKIFRESISLDNNFTFNDEIIGE